MQSKSTYIVIGGHMYSTTSMWKHLALLSSIDDYHYYFFYLDNYVSTYYV